MPTLAAAADWQYRVSYERGPDRRGKQQEAGEVLLWLPPESETIHAILLCGRLGIEGELVIDPQVRDACRVANVAIVYFTPHVSGVFHYWESGNRDGERILKAIDALAKQSGHEELRRVPWITAGHSTAGIFARNVAYWQPERTAAVIHLKSGNFQQKDHLPPKGSLAGIPLIAVNGQLETYGPEGGIRPELGRETQWTYVLKDIQQFRRQDEDHLMSLLVHPGADHFHGAPEIAAFVATFIKKTVEFRVPDPLPSGDIKCLLLRAQDGWLVDADLYNQQAEAAPYNEFTGDRKSALWLYDQELAKAALDFQRNLGQHQVLSNPECTWTDEGNGWIFRAKAEYLDVMPEKFGGRVGGRKVGHSKSNFIYRPKISDPIEQIGKDQFRLLRPAKRVYVAAFHPGDDKYRSTIRWGSIEMPKLKNVQKQIIEFAKPNDLKADSRSIRLNARASSGLPVYYEVDYGPISIEDGNVRVTEIPTKAVFPLHCKVTAYQIGRRTKSPIEAADPVSIQFLIVK